MGVLLVFLHGFTELLHLFLEGSEDIGDGFGTFGAELGRSVGGNVPEHFLHLLEFASVLLFRLLFGGFRILLHLPLVFLHGYKTAFKGGLVVSHEGERILKLIFLMLVGCDQRVPFLTERGYEVLPSAGTSGLDQKNRRHRQDDDERKAYYEDKIKCSQHFQNTLSFQNYAISVDLEYFCGNISPTPR